MEWGEVTGLDPQLISARIRDGRSIGEALAPSNEWKRTYTRGEKDGWNLSYKHN